MILCDTNILIEIYRANLDVIAAVKSIGQQNLAVSDVTCGELLFGARNKKELLPKEIRVEEKMANEKVLLISQLDEDDKTAVYRIIDGMRTKNKIQIFFEQNI